MRLTARQTLSIMIGFVCLLLALGLARIIDTVSYYEPFGYGAGGIGIVVSAGIIGLLVVLLLLLLIMWPRLGGDRGLLSEIERSWPILQINWIVLSICGWVGTFWVVLGIAGGWDRGDILLGITILLPALISAYQIVRQQRSHFYWIVLSICGWLGTFWAVIGIARNWDQGAILLGTAILLPALGSAYQIVRKQRLYS